MSGKLCSNDEARCEYKTKFTDFLIPPDTLQWDMRTYGTLKFLTDSLNCLLLEDEHDNYRRL